MQFSIHDQLISLHLYVLFEIDQVHLVGDNNFKINNIIILR